MLIFLLIFQSIGPAPLYILQFFSFRTFCINLSPSLFNCKHQKKKIIYSSSFVHGSISLFNLSNHLIFHILTRQNSLEAVYKYSHTSCKQSTPIIGIFLEITIFLNDLKSLKNSDRFGSFFFEINFFLKLEIVTDYWSYI